MEREAVILGSSNSIRIAIEWRSNAESDGPIGKTWGDLQLWIGDSLVWGSVSVAERPVGITWSWIDLFEFLANAWPYLANEEQQPIAFTHHKEAPARLSELWGRAQVRWMSVPDDIADREDKLLRDFLAVHDLAEALPGAQPPQLLLMRQGERMIVSSVRQQWELPYMAVMSVLAELCEFIADRIKDLSDDRSRRSIERWNQRDSLSHIKRLQIATGRSEGELRQIWPTDLDATASNEDRYELRAAARMLDKRIPENKQKEILKLIYDLPKGKPLALKPLQDEAEEVIAESGSSDPTLQGYVLATMLRAHFSRLNARVNPDEILQGWGVTIRRLDDKNLLLDAIAVWANDRSPTILLNQNGPRARHLSGTRSTLAHEICHLLLDTDGALPAVEVLGGVIPHAIEQRANAFAAEFLLPRNIAAKYIHKELKYTYQEKERERQVDSVMDQLSDEFGVSHETIAWQIINSDCVADDLKLIERIKNKYLNSIKSPFIL